jgi:hypothetical protein
VMLAKHLRLHILLLYVFLEMEMVILERSRRIRAAGAQSQPVRPGLVQ